MKHAIITGATGFVGIHLVSDLLSRGVQVTALCRENSPNISRLPSGVKTVYRSDELQAADVYYHLAWEGASGTGRGDAALQARNAEMTLNALTAAHQLGCGKFVALGTVYEKLAPRVRGANHFSGPDFYILSKDYARSTADKLAHKLGIDFVWCTVCHPIGRFIKPEQLMAYVVSNLLAGKVPTFGPAETPYDIVAVESLAYGLMLAGKCKLSNREYYIGSGTPQVLKRWLEEARYVLGTDTALGIGERPDDGMMFDKDWFDIAPFADETGYAPKIGFAEAVNNVSVWLKGK